MEKKKSLRTLFVGVLSAVALLLCVIGAACTSDGEPKAEGPETGIYYNDQGDSEYLLNLFNGDRFTLYIDGTNKFGTYLLDGESLTFAASEEEVLSATLSGETIVLDYNSAEIRFLKKINYRVEFDSNGGSSVESKTVLNGKTLSQPQDPSREGFAFLGWYADAEFKSPYQFGASVTQNATLYARWGEKQVGQAEYAVSFDWNMPDLENPAQVSTVGGRVYSNFLPEVPELSGYRFDGWWVSMVNEGDKLSYQYTEDTVFGENTTLFALWQSTDSATKLFAPLVNVSEKLVSWNGATGVNRYSIRIESVGTGSLLLSDSISATSIGAVDFSLLPAGDYKVSVTALASDSSNNSDTSVRYYRNKALKRVSLVNIVEPAQLTFQGVENATEYEITVSCGNAEHNHTNFSIQNSTYFSFVNCEMKEGGITYTITAKANGYASSISEVFVYNRELKAINTLYYNNSTQTLVWDAVENATNYFVSVNGGDFTDNGSFTSFSLKEFDAEDGKLEVKVYPATKGYNSPAASALTCEKSGLSAPKNLRLADGNTLAWDAVAGATSYEVKIGNKTVPATDTQLTLSDNFSMTEGETYAMSVKAKGTGESLWSDAYSATYLTFDGTLGYANGTLYWTPVLGADGLELSVNGGNYRALDAYASSVKVTLTQAGNNTFAVRFVKNNVASRAITVQVYAYTITFNSNLGASVPAQYKAMGDEIELTDAVKANYEFEGWYNIASGAAGNGSKFDGKFTATGDTTLYAYYLPKSFTLTYSSGKSGFVEKPSAQVKYRENYKLEVPVSTQPTQMFAGWWTGENGTGAQLTDIYGNSLGIWTTPGNATVYAKWTDDVLRFELTKVAGSHEDVYRVSAGSSRQDEITIPATYNGLPVAVIVADAFYSTSYKVINIPDTMRVISSEAFGKCSDLTAVNIYHVEGNNSIRYYSHEGVLYDYGALDDQPEDKTWLTSTLQFYPRGKASDNYEIPDRVTTIATGAFEHVSGNGLLAVTVPASVTYVASHAFSREDIQTVTFKDPVVASMAQDLTIADNAFYQCASLKTVNLPARLQSVNTVSYVLGRAETGTPSASSVQTGSNEGVPTSFYMCSKLEALNVGTNGTGKYYSSKDGILYNANQSTLIYAPVKAKSIADAEGKFTVPSGVTSVQRGAFFGNRALSELTIAYTVTEIGECAFYDCWNYSDGFTKITFEGSGYTTFNTKIGKYAFRKCIDLTTVEFGEGFTVSEIGEGAFMDCSYLEELTIPAGMTTIGDQAFRNCSDLETLVFAESDSELSFGEFVFDGCSSLKTVSLPKNATTVPNFGGIALETVIIDENNPHLTVEDSVVFNAEKDTLYFYPANKTDTTYTIPDTVKTIASGAFQGALNLTSIHIGKNVESIGDSAFFECESLETITFAQDAGRNLTIGSYAFTFCPASSLVLPARLTSIGAYAFAGMENLTTFELKSELTAIPDGMLMETGVTSFTVGNSVKSIGEDAFRGSALETLTFGSAPAVTYIGYAAFGATALTAFTLPDSVEMLDKYAFYNAESLTTFTIGENSNLQTIGMRAFYESGIKAIFIPKSVEKILPGAFYYSDLETITFAQDGDKDLYLGEYTTYVDDEGMNRTTYGEVFQNTALKEVHFPARLKELGRSSFEGCKSLTTVTFGEDSRLMYIAESLFERCEKLESITIPKSVGDRSSVGDPHYSSGAYRFAISTQAFADCVSLTEVITEKGNYNAFTIADYAFGNAYSYSYANDKLTDITSFTFPEGLERVFDSAFGCCVNLQFYYINGDKEDGNSNNVYGAYDGILYSPDFKELLLCPAARGAVDNGAADGKDYTAITLHADVQAINEDAFDDCSGIAKITIPANMSKFDAGTLSGCSNLSEIAVDGEGLYAADGKMLYNGDKTELLLVPVKLFDGETNSSIEFPANLKKIGNSAFYNIEGLKSVSFANITEEFEIGEYAFYGCTGLTEVHLPQSLKKMGKSVFEGCSKLEVIEFAAGCALTAIPETAFVDCTSLVEIEIPALVTEIPSAVVENTLVWNNWYDRWDTGKRFAGVFHGCENLETVTFAQGSVLETIGSYAFEIDAEWNDRNDALGDYPDHEGSLTTVEIPNSVTSIGDYAFYDCVSLKSVTLPDELLVLGNGIFWYCQSLEKVNYDETTKKNHLPEHVTTIGDEAFFYCKSLPNLVVGGNVTSFGFSAFAKCEALESINIPQSVIELRAYESSTYRSYAGMFYECTSLKTVDLQTRSTSLPKNMFYGCSKLETLEIPATVTTLGEYMLRNAGLKSFTLPESIANIPDGLLSGCSSLTSLTLHNGVSAIGSSAFSGTAITKVTVSGSETSKLPDSLLTLGSSAFQSCTKLTSLDLSSTGVKTLDSDAFYGCTNLRTLNLPATLETIGRRCFRQSGLTSFTLPAKVTAIPNEMLYGCSDLETLTLHNDVTSIGQAAFASTGISSFKLPAGVTAVPQQMLYGCGNLTTINLHENVESLGGYAFGKTAITSFTFPAKVTSIPNGTESSGVIYGLFSECADLQEITIPSTVTSIGSYAFYGCTQLKEITIPSTVTSIGSYAFYGCTQLTTEKLIIEEGVTTIAAFAFANCTGLTSFEIPASVTSYASSALSGCTVTLSVAEGSTSYCYENGVMYNADKSSILFFVGSISGFTWEKTTSVARGAFNGVTLNQVTVKAGATVGDYVFEYAIIKNLVIEAGTLGEDGKAYTNFVTLGDYAFQYATIESMTIGDGTQVGKSTATSSNSNVFNTAKIGTVTVGNGVHFGQYSFRNATAAPGMKFAVTLGNNVYLGRESFNKSYVESVTLGQNNTIEYDVFYQSYSMSEIFIPKTTIVGNEPFYGWSSSRTLYLECTAEEVTAKVAAGMDKGGWHSNWKGGASSVNVVYGATGLPAGN